VKSVFLFTRSSGKIPLVAREKQLTSLGVNELNVRLMHLVLPGKLDNCRVPSAC
jgi:hypothetical protein